MQRKTNTKNILTIIFHTNLQQVIKFSRKRKKCHKQNMDKKYKNNKNAKNYFFLQKFVIKKS